MSKFKPIVYRAHNGYDTEEASNASAITIEGLSMTAQEMAEDADINVLMKRYGLLGTFPTNPRVPMQGDFSDLTDFRGAIEAISKATDMFMEYPAALRARFDNDPGKFTEFCLQEENRDEMLKLGLIKAPPPGPDGPTGTRGTTVPAKPPEAPKNA